MEDKLEIHVVIGYSSYTSWDCRDEQGIIGVFYTHDNAAAYSAEYLKIDNREYDKTDIEVHIVK